MRPRRPWLTTLGIVTAALAVFIAVWHFTHGEPVFGAAWTVLAVWWIVWSAFLPGREARSR